MNGARGVLMTVTRPGKKLPRGHRGIGEKSSAILRTVPRSERLPRWANQSSCLDHIQGVLRAALIAAALTASDPPVPGKLEQPL